MELSLLAKFNIKVKTCLIFEKIWDKIKAMNPYLRKEFLNLFSPYNRNYLELGRKELTSLQFNEKLQVKLGIRS